MRTMMARAPLLREIHSDPSSLDGVLPGQVDDSSQTNAPFPTNIRCTNVYQRTRPPLPKAVAELRNCERPDTVIRTISAQSLPIPPQFEQPFDSDDETSLTPYEKQMYLLKNDLMIQKDVTLGRRIGFYKLGKELGAGNFSKVKLGVHVLTREKVAVKIMERSRMDQKAQQLLLREIQAMEELHHPNIIRLFECIETMTRTFLIMEYAGGGELYAYIRDRIKLTEEECKPLYSQIVAAVAHMHTLHIVHRDIKAENVIFARPGQVKLADFGFSCKMDDEGKLKTFCGSPPYAAPELYKDEEYYGPMVDVWALGVLLYFMLVGNTPFRGETIADLRQNILKGFFDLPDHLSSYAQLIITRMLELNPEKRMTVFDIKKTFWLKDCSFAHSYLHCKLHPRKDELKKNPLLHDVWENLNQYGISEEMLREAFPKGPHNAIVGTYRIVLHQMQIKAEQERQRVRLEAGEQRAADVIAKRTPMLNRSKTCTLF